MRAAAAASDRRLQEVSVLHYRDLLRGVTVGIRVPVHDSDRVTSEREGGRAQSRVRVPHEVQDFAHGRVSPGVDLMFVPCRQLVRGEVGVGVVRASLDKDAEERGAGLDAVDSRRASGPRRLLRLGVAVHATTGKRAEHAVGRWGSRVESK